MTIEFKKDLSHISWEEVKRRQLARLSLVHDWMLFVDMQKGSRVLDIGPGPGVFVKEYVKRIAEEGKIYIVEKSADAIEYLQTEIGSDQKNIHIQCIDAEVFLPSLEQIDIVMVTDVLHHTATPMLLLLNIFDAISSPSTRILISEFDADATGQFGPPLSNRIPKNDLRQWVENIGFSIEEQGYQEYEHYYFVLKKSVIHNITAQGTQSIHMRVPHNLG